MRGLVHFVPKRISLVPRRGWPLRSSHPRQRFEIFGCLFDAELYRFQDNQDSHWNTLSALRLDIRFRPYRDFRIRVNRYALSCPDFEDGLPWVLFTVSRSL